MKYYICYTRKDGKIVINELYTADRVTDRIMQLEKDGCSRITIKSDDWNKEREEE